ncbi:MAG: 30S ribosomal protein S1 [Deltaproteobacteria bacterium]|nr:30S ribosomal protein S1 [Deltaproteobacteria bacterium]
MTEGEENKSEETAQVQEPPEAQDTSEARDTPETQGTSDVREASENEEASATEDDFQSLFEESLQAVKPGGVVTGKVVDVNPTHVVVDVGYKTEGRISVQEFQDRDGTLQVALGDDVDVFFESPEGDRGEIVLSRQKAESIKVWDRIEKAHEQMTPIEGTIVARVKGGFKVDVGVDGFLPGSHVDIRPTRNLDQFVGKRDRFTILKYNRMRDNVVVSRKVLLEKEREVLKKETLAVLDEGVILEGVVKNITDYGAFVDVGGIDGILHITDMSWGRVNHPSDLLSLGETLRVVVLKFDKERERISLGMKQITPDPWESVAERYPVDSKITGKVVGLTDYGAFVELEKGVEGLIHVSEMSWAKKLSHPSKVVQAGETVEAMVLNVDPGRRRISLGLRQVLPNPWFLAKEKYPEGSVIQGPVRNITDFGVFVGVEEGIDGLIHISDLDWTKKIKHPSELYKKGDIVEAKVLGVDPQVERFSLGVKQLTMDPWERVVNEHPPGSRITGPIVRVLDFGVFVRVAEGVEGLIHVSQLSTEHVDKPSSLHQVGDVVEAEVVNVDLQERKIGLSIRALKRSEEREELETYLKREKEAGRFSFETILNEELKLDRENRPGTDAQDGEKDDV